MAALVVRVDGRVDRVFELRGPELMIGRAEGEGWLTLPDDSVSRSHARIWTSDRGDQLEDLSSSSGVFVNGQLVDHATLGHGDVIRIGRYTLYFLDDSQGAPRFEGTSTSAMPDHSVAPRAPATSGSPSWGSELLPLGGPAPIIVVREPDRPERRFTLSLNDTIVGRGEEADLRLPNVSISRFHVRLSRTYSGTMLVDLGSRNQTRMNERPVHQVEMRTGDAIQIGCYELIYYGPEVAGLARQQLLQLPIFADSSLSRGKLNARLISATDDIAWRLDRPMVTLGAGADVPARGWFVFGPVAEIIWSGDGHMLRSRTLTTATRLNLRRIGEALLRPGDLIEIGRSRFRYLVG